MNVTIDTLRTLLTTMTYGETAVLVHHESGEFVRVTRVTRGWNVGTTNTTYADLGMAADATLVAVTTDTTPVEWQYQETTLIPEQLEAFARHEPGRVRQYERGIITGGELDCLYWYGVFPKYLHRPETVVPAPTTTKSGGKPCRKFHVTDRVRPFVKTPYYDGQPVHHRTGISGKVHGEDAPAGWVAVKLEDERVEFWRTTETRTKLLTPGFAGVVS